MIIKTNLCIYEGLSTFIYIYIINFRPLESPTATFPSYLDGLFPLYCVCYIRVRLNSNIDIGFFSSQSVIDTILFDYLYLYFILYFHVRLLNSVLQFITIFYIGLYFMYLCIGSKFHSTMCRYVAIVLCTCSL